jgi:hypothetical protein
MLADVMFSVDRRCSMLVTRILYQAKMTDHGGQQQIKGSPSQIDGCQKRIFQLIERELVVIVKNGAAIQIFMYYRDKYAVSTILSCPGISRLLYI